MPEPVCDATIRPTDKSGYNPLKIAGVDRVAARGFVDGERKVTGLPHSRVHELRELGYEVEVTNGDDPEDLAKAAAKVEAKASKAEAKAEAAVEAQVEAEEPVKPPATRSTRKERT
jgi:hypothetical protein